MAKCKVVARNLFMRAEGETPLRLRECEIGEELEFSGEMPGAWTGKVELIASKAKPAGEKKLVQSNSGGK
jgi:hypothetical protein